MNILKRFFKKAVKKENPYAEKHLENADIILSRGEDKKFSFKQRQERFDQWYQNRKTIQI